MAQRKLKRTDDSIVWGHAKTICICKSGDKSDKVHVSLVLLPLSYCNMVLEVEDVQI